MWSPPWRKKGLTTTAAAGLLRTKLQHHYQEIGLVFAGSQLSLMRAMFTDVARPFYGQAELVEQLGASIDFDGGVGTVAQVPKLGLTPPPGMPGSGGGSSTIIEIQIRDWHEQR